MVWNFAPDAPTVALPPHASPEVRLYSDKMPPPVDLIALRLGLSSFERLLDPLMARITSIRRHIALELGLVVPGVRFRDDRLLPADGYAIDLHALEVARAELRRDHVLAIAPEDRLAKLHGEKTTDPTYGMPGLWIEISQKEAAEALGCMIFDEISVIATQLTEAVRVHAHELLGMQEVKALFDALAKSHPVVAESLPLSVAELHQVLQRLVRERVSIRDMVTILETLTREAPDTRDIETLTERVRVALQKVICKEHTNNEGAINVITVDPSIENMLLQGREIGPEGAPFVIDPMAGQSVLQAIGCEVQKLQERGLQSILLTSPELRPAAVKLVARSFPKMVVLSWNEIPPRVNINPIGMVSAG
ncbi:MAG TPA: FHIPEP family type III secretion protein [Candidatus Xenobia bacterium]